MCGSHRRWLVLPMVHWVIHDFWSGKDCLWMLKGSFTLCIKGIPGPSSSAWWEVTSVRRSPSQSICSNSQSQQSSHISDSLWLGPIDNLLDIIRIPQDTIFRQAVPKELVFGLGTIFRLERSAIFITEFRARLELGAINFHLKPCMFTWVKICSPFEIIILALYSKVSSYHLTSTDFQITT